MSYAKLGMAAIGAAAAYGLSRGQGRRARGPGIYPVVSLARSKEGRYYVTVEERTTGTFDVTPPRYRTAKEARAVADAIEADMRTPPYLLIGQVREKYGWDFSDRGRRAAGDVEILRSSHFEPWGKVMVVFDKKDKQYRVESRFTNFYRSHKGLRPNTPKARAALDRAIARFEEFSEFGGYSGWEFGRGRRAMSKAEKRALVAQAWEKQGVVSRPAEDLPPPIPGMEGPFRYRSGKILYYDPRAGRHYDRGSDMYVSVEDVEFATSGRRARRRR